MADNRVLNFSEFGKKYNQESEQDVAASYADFSNAADNFQEGFDEDTYEKGQSGPKRPINSETSETPAQPGEEGAPSFSAEPTEGMEAPGAEEEEEMDDTITPDEVEDDADEDLTEIEDEDYEGGDPEAGEEDEEEEDEDEEEEEEEEEANESKFHRINRNTIMLESFDDFEINNKNLPYSSQPHSRGYDDVLNTIELDFDDDDENDDSCFVTCKSCGAKKTVEPGTYPMGAENISNPDSWWQGAELGMQCGCNYK